MNAFNISNRMNEKIIHQNFNNSSLTIYYSIFEFKSRLNTSDKLFLFVYMIIFIVGLIGNLLVIYFVIFYKRMQTMTNKLITNLSLADLLVLIICVPVTASRYMSNEWVLGEAVCKSSGFIQG